MNRLHDNQQGNFLILFIFSITIFLGIIGTISASGFYLKQKTQTLTVCRSNLISIQNNMKLNLISLMALNGKAKFLRVSKETTKKSLKIALSIGQIKLAATLKGILKKIEISQKILKLKQQALLTSAITFSVAKFISLKSSISVDIKQAPFSKKLAVRKVDPWSLTPSYYPEYNFTSKQEIKIIWEEDPLRNVPRFIRKMFANIPMVKGSCAASLKKKGANWKSILI